MASAVTTNTPAEYTFNNDPAIIDFTWQQLLDYNKAFLRGEKKTTFYHASPLVSDQVPSDLIKLHDLGVFTLDGQGAETTDTYQQRAYLTCLMPRDVMVKFVINARKDPEVIVEVSLIRAKRQVHLSKELRDAWTTGPGYLSLTRGKEKPEMAEWEDYTTNPEPMVMLYAVEDKKFRNWSKWIKDDYLCYVFIADKEYGQEPKSMPARIVGYLTATGGRRRHTRKHKSRNRVRNTRIRR
jgi:hypothetical protein